MLVLEFFVHCLPRLSDEINIKLLKCQERALHVTQALQGDLSPRKGSANCLHLRTPGGQQVTLDDQKKSLTVVTHDGHRIELSPGTMELHAAGNLNIKAPGKRITITASSVDFQQG